MKSFSLQNKTILITGASSGIGKAIAIFCASLGAKCVLSGRNIERLNLVLQTLEGDGHSSIDADITEQTGVNKIVDEILNLDGLIHSAGIMQLLPFRSISPLTFEKIMNINLYAPFYLSQALLKKRKINNSAAIIFLSSISGNIIGSKGNLMYSASKSAVNGIIKVLALELAEKKIRVNGIAAGMVKTEMWINNNMLISKEQLNKDETLYPLGYGEPADIAGIAAFLVSDAAKWITGSIIIADGGFTAQ
jgi:NAD(P)-dependent dehydrogenase (short-subunit alcohol dehydrogenase family)